MRRRLQIGSLGQMGLVAALCLAGSLAHAQQHWPPPYWPQQSCPTPPPYPYPYTVPGGGVPPELTTQPGMMGQPGATTTPPGGESGTASTAETTFASLSGGAGVGSSLALAAPGAYLDSAIPKNMFRVRYDAGFDINRPDRAEFFYATWRELSFHPHAINGGGIFFDPKARGPDQLAAELDYQEVSSYLELAYNNRLSAFIEVPVRFLHFRHLQEDMPESERKPSPNLAPNPGSPFFPEPLGENTETPDTTPSGVGDIDVGIKAAILADPCRYLTLQFRTYIPTGDAGKGLSTGHVSLEPGVLYYQRFNRLVFQGQFRDWIPVDGGQAAGNVIIYGLGLGYDVYRRGNLCITPISEFVGWTVLNGFESFFGPVAPAPSGNALAGIALPTTHGVADASGDTIVNVKIGVRTYFCEGHDMYVGWGHALTGDRWYKDILRVEYRYCF